MKKDFHSKSFDDATLLKLEIFKRYIREWLPVFMAKRDGCVPFDRVNIYDFFAGPGRDGNDNPGSPLIIQEEVKAFCEARAQLKAETPIRMIFNDIQKSHIEKLRESVEEMRCSKDCCSFEYCSEPFLNVVEKYLPSMRERGQANLVILDQFGVKEVTPEIVQKILAAGTTDILFFISTASIRRFAATPEFRDKFKLDSEEIKTVAYNTVHRFLCDHFRSQLTAGNAMLAPFSIKKKSNIYGIIFATTHELGMEKFLKVCWGLDRVTGEASYNIDNEVTWNGQQSLFTDDNTPTKETVFETELLSFIKDQNPSNKRVFRFGLERGFCSAKCNDALKVLQGAGKIEVEDISTMKSARKGAFYLMDAQDRVRLRGV